MQARTTFDSGFRVASLLRHTWLRDQLVQAGWNNADSIIAATPETELWEILECLKARPDDGPVWLVVGDWSLITYSVIKPQVTVVALT